MDKPRLNQPPDRPTSNNQSRDKSKHQNQSKNQSNQQNNITQTIIDTLKDQNTFKDYPIRDLVKHSEEFGGYLQRQKLKTNQIRKFLDAINRIKVRLTQKKDNQPQESIEQQKQKAFKSVESEIVLLKPKLAYAAARLKNQEEKAAQDLSKVIGKAIDKTKSLEDFERLVQFIESIIAYHKSAGGE